VLVRTDATGCWLKALLPMILSMIAITAMPSALPRMVPPAPCHDLLSAEPTFGARATTAARTERGLDTTSAHRWQAGTALARKRAPQLALPHRHRV
jgi:hypothetical protein